MKHRAFTWIEAVVTLAIVCISAAILFPAPNGTRENARRSSCQSNLKQIAVSFAQYARDYDDQFPPLANLSAIRSAAIAPYVPDADVFQCPSTLSHAANTTDYFINARLAGAKSAFGKSGTTFTILGGDGADDQAPNAHLTQLPDSWRKDYSSPANRHIDGSNYLFADGHVKWLKPEKIGLEKPSAGQPTFLVEGEKP